MSPAAAEISSSRACSLPLLLFLAFFGFLLQPLGSFLRAAQKMGKRGAQGIGWSADGLLKFILRNTFECTVLVSVPSEDDALTVTSPTANTLKQFGQAVILMSI